MTIIRYKIAFSVLFLAVLLLFVLPPWKVTPWRWDPTFLFVNMLATMMTMVCLILLWGFL